MHLGVKFTDSDYGGRFTEGNTYPYDSARGEVASTSRHSLCWETNGALTNSITPPYISTFKTAAPTWSSRNRNI